MSNDEVVAVLNDLLETCYDGLQGFRAAAEELHRQDAIAFCLSRSQRIDEAAAELYTAIRHLEGHPAERGHAVAGVHRGWIHLRAAAPTDTDDAILAEIERGEEVAVQHYRHALEEPLPPSIHDLVDDQRRGVEATLAHVRAMRQSGRP
jgi:uncharacterized protein (TIGR02284 family)